MKIKIQEISSSIQGEFPLIGAPCTIIRLAGCNLQCDYCDAPNEEGVTYTSSQLRDEVCLRGNRTVLITGGEPLLQETQVSDLALLLTNDGYDVVIETNGTIPLDNVVPVCHIAMDVKLFLEDHTTEINNLPYLQHGDVLKFVYRDLEDFDKACGFIHTNIPKTPPYQIVFSPVDPSNFHLQSFLSFCTAYPDYDIRMQVQLHKVLGVA